MSMIEPKVDFAKLSDKYAGKWIAFDPESNAVIAVGSSATEVLDLANKKGIEEPIITDVVEDYSAYVPCTCR